MKLKIRRDGIFQKPCVNTDADHTFSTEAAVSTTGCELSFGSCKTSWLLFIFSVCKTFEQILVLGNLIKTIRPANV